jgi:hypothetical protein
MCNPLIVSSLSAVMKLLCIIWTGFETRTEKKKRKEKDKTNFYFAAETLTLIPLPRLHNIWSTIVTSVVSTTLHVIICSSFISFTLLLFSLFPSFSSYLTFLVLPFFYLFSFALTYFTLRLYISFFLLCPPLLPHFPSIFLRYFCRIMTEMTNVTANVGGCFHIPAVRNSNSCTFWRDEK